MKSELIRVFRALTDENRIRVLELLCEGEQCACVLLEGLQISQPSLSHHMKILCDSGIVKSRRVGPWQYYSIDSDGCKYAKRLLTCIANHKLNTTLYIMGIVRRLFHVFKKNSFTEASVRPADTTIYCCAEKF